MTAKVDLTFKEGESWKIVFVAHRADGSIFPLTSGMDVEFAVRAISNEVPLILKKVGQGITITDDVAGEAEILVMIDEVQAAGIGPGSDCLFEIRTIAPDETLPQAEGRLIIQSSLFGSGEDPLLRQFRMRFPEFTQDDEIILMYLNDAKVIVDGDLPNAKQSDKDLAQCLLAAHLLYVRKVGSQVYTSGGGAAIGAIKSIRVEDKSVMYETGGNQMQLKATFRDSSYGIQYLSMLRRQTLFVMRA